ncbi:3-deoxy-7-phosphoheptulonate synthase [Clostridium sporogenes]|uniref:3-deoxy-7-phosphoheptulonate synthase n=1 Tax=Clostridium sporogenes TaxID=1509 RepID=A0A7U4LMZ8_CLOSG|nr:MULTISPECIES: 3-deoxy-7-phosphoheptulonate synthase [Clostridium]AVP61984.1 3-deoxy-7-phosphoheptulonate synthase [Clostridium botulinum]AKC62724.1 phospho-2-dehydro-3-deoxyheptonate aldolase AroF [Clostridium sporogenes]AKJ89977.1 3-deoxy-7-phosphoheptulonate synthase [Clostridium sporogenes]KCZ68102.1 phospho-2-dehydro-3-deoxyheptonate aldolase AroF [Clostridium sporogenes]KOY66912.1 3-deoxy-7-phosphoheptulonate synthase [Clostridium sporogenes]
MFIVLDQSTVNIIDDIDCYLNKLGIAYEIHKTQSSYIIYIKDNLPKQNIDYLKNNLKVKIISSDFGILVNKKQKDKTIIKLNDLLIGNKNITFISGPCSVESEEQIIETSKQVKKYGANILRGGAFKPRTSPYDFQGLGKEGIKLLYKAKQITGLPIVSEIMCVQDLQLFYDYVDIIQVGARNMQNYSLLKELGKINKPILLKRGLSASIKEFLLSAEYIMLNGNDKIILCERGIRTYENYTRNTMDISAISLIKTLTHLPVFADPSHATGNRQLIMPLTLASVAAGADGIVIESHICPEKALSDGEQSILPLELKKIISISNKIKSLCNETL